MPQLARFVVLNPGGRDPEQDFAAGAGHPSDPGHPPINFHAYAACMNGLFLRRASHVPNGSRVVLLLRPRHLATALKSAEELRRKSCRIWIAWKEAGTGQVASALEPSRRWEQFVAITKAADGAVCATPDLVPLHEAAGASVAQFVPTPYPLGEPGWDFTQPLAQRQGVLIGTREFDVPSRCHALALATLASLAHPVTVLNTSGAGGRLFAKGICPHAHIVEGPLAYPAYLKLMASHRIVFQLDRSAVPGQVAGDALLCGMPCVGGDGAIERVAFADLTSHGRTPRQCLEFATRLLDNDDAWQQTMNHALSMASSTLAFPAVRQALESLTQDA
jgi:hypothetical protein